MSFRAAREREFHLPESLIGVSAARDVDRECLTDPGIGKMRGDIFAVGCVRQPFADRGELGLTRGRVKVSEEVGAVAREMTATAQSVSGGPPLGRIDLRLREHAAAQQPRDLVGVTRLRLGFAAGKRFHLAGRAQAKGTPFLCAAIRQPLPRNQTLAAAAAILSLRSKHSQKRLRRRRHVFVDEVGAVLIEKTAVQRLRMELEAAILGRLLCREVHPGLLLMGVKFGSRHHTAAHHGRGGLDEYQHAPPHRRPLAVLDKRERIRLGGGR